jgi:hypothetical protein
MTINPKPIKTVRLLVALLMLSMAFITACKKLGEAPVKSTDATAAARPLDSVTYLWGDLSGTRRNDLDMISYTSDGKIATVLNNYDGGYQLNKITFTYQDNKIILNTNASDVYTLDVQNRVSLHDSKYIEPNGDTVSYEEQYHYDDNGYLSKVLLTGSFIYGKFTYGEISYAVQNGNYTSFTLADTTGKNVTRKYTFSYNKVAVNSAFSFYSPIFANNTFTAIEKYLNFGKQSVNQITAIGYLITNVDNATQTGIFAVNTTVDKGGNIKQMTLTGPAITGQPADNLSPLPRQLSFTYNK